VILGFGELGLFCAKRGSRRAGTSTSFQDFGFFTRCGWVQRMFGDAAGEEAGG